jgi:hypothetical protein
MLTEIVAISLGSLFFAQAPPLSEKQKNMQYLNQLTSCLQVYERNLNNLEVTPYFKPAFAPMSFDPDGNGLACELSDRPIWEKIHNDSENK